MEIKGRFGATEYMAGVDPRGNLGVQARSVDITMAAALEGEYYILASSLLNIPASGGSMFYFKYTEPTKLMALHYFDVKWNGDNTNHTKPIMVEFKSGTTTPPNTNIVQINPINMNQASPNVVSMEAYEWDGVGNGMTGYAPNVTTREFPWHVGQEPYTVVTILGKDAALVVDLTPISGIAGQGEIEVGFCLIDPNKDKIG